METNKLLILFIKHLEAFFEAVTIISLPENRRYKLIAKKGNRSISTSIDVYDISDAKFLFRELLPTLHSAVSLEL